MIVTKALALVDTVETDDPNGAFEVILSAATLDRDGEVIDSRAFEPLPDHIPFDIDHGMTVTTTVGSGTPYYAEDGTLRVKGTFASTSLAQEVRTLVAEGHVRTTSVTFMAADRVKDEKGVPHVQTAELLNGTFTPVPSNREAVVLSAKSLEAVTEKVGARNSAADAEVIQSAHDAMVTLGADCSGAKAVSAAREAKAIAGSLEATQERVQDALNDAYGTTHYVWLRATMPDFCVYELTPVDGGSECETYKESITDDGAVVTLGGDAELVDVAEVVVPDADADREEADSLKSADNAAEAAAVEAAAPAVKSADEAEIKAALLSITENAAHFAFGG